MTGETIKEENKVSNFLEVFIERGKLVLTKNKDINVIKLHE